MEGRLEPGAAGVEDQVLTVTVLERHGRRPASSPTRHRLPFKLCRHGRHRRCRGVGNEMSPSRRQAEGNAAGALTIFLGLTLTATCSVLWPRG
jgi:hypothetical protein